MKNGFVMYTDWIDMLEELDDESRGKLFLALMRYQNGEEIPDMDIGARVAFAQMRKVMQRDNDKYEEVSKARREAGTKGGRPNANETKEKQKKQMVSDEKQKKQMVSEQKQKNPDNDNDNEHDNERTKDIKGYMSPPAAVTASRITDAWNADPYVQHIQSMTDKRKAALKERLSTYGEDKIMAAIKRVSLSSFCHGGNDRGWQANIDWFLRPDTVEKLLEGTYDDRKGKPPEKRQNSFSKGVMQSDYGDMSELEKQLLGG